MKRQIDSYYLYFTVTIALLMLITACSLSTGQNNDHAPVIEQLNVVHPALYPLGNTQIECFAVDSLNHTLTYTWFSNDGKIVGSGSKVIWEAPATYGDYHIMVTVDDGSGNPVKKITTVTVIVREPAKPCASCPK